MYEEMAVAMAQQGWTLDNWSVLWTAIGAVGQILGAGATVWAVVVALGSSKREKGNLRRTMRMKHIEMAPQLRVVKLDKEYDEYADDEGNFLRTTGRGAKVFLDNQRAAGVASHVSVEVVSLVGIPLPNAPSEFDYIPAGKGYEFSFEWNQEESDVAGTIRIKYRGPLGAKYQKEYGFHTTAEMAFVEFVSYPDRDRVEYPEDI